MEHRGSCEMLRFPVLFRKSQDRRALRKNHIATSSLHTVPKLTLVLSCRGYHLPDLIRERNTGKVSQARLLSLKRPYICIPRRCAHEEDQES